MFSVEKIRAYACRTKISSATWKTCDMPFGNYATVVSLFWVSLLGQKKWIHIQKRSPVGPRYPDGDPFGNNASLESLFWVSICSSAACFPGSGRKEEPGKMEEPGLNFCRERFAIVLWTFCDFFPTFLPLMPLMHLMVACQCQNKSPAHFLLQIIAIF